MSFITYLSTISAIALANCVSAGMQNKIESPFGLTFTPTAVVASRFNASGLVEVIRQSLSPDYQTYYHDAVSQYGTPMDQNRDMNGAKAMFHHAATPITETLSKQLGHMPKYSALFIPSVFDHRVRDAAADAVFHDYFQRAVMAGSSRQAACHAYGFLEGKNLGRAPEVCNDDGPLNLILVLEYEWDYLYAWLMEVEFELETYPVNHERFCRECGEQYREEIGEQAYNERLRLLLHDFVNDQASQNHHKYERDSIRAIILAGEASTLAMTELGFMAREAVGTDAVKVMTEIDPSEVVAHGAAVWARMTQEIPHIFIPAAGNKIVGEHDEL